MTEPYVPTEPLTPGPRTHYSWLTSRMRLWLERREKDLALKMHGSICKCPWCHRWMQMNTATWVEDGPKGYHDVFHCGHCGGTSLWEWMVGFHLLRPLAPPIKELEDGDYDNAFVTGSMLRTLLTRAETAEREAEAAEQREAALREAAVEAEAYLSDVRISILSPEYERGCRVIKKLRATLGIGESE